jgi:hypothetical protein
MPSRLRLAAALLTLTTIGCSSPTSPENRLDQAQHRWSLRGPDSYSLVITRHCECLPEQSGPTRVVVRDQEVVTRWFLPEDRPITDTFAPFFPDVSGLFEIVRSALRDGVEVVDVTHDPWWGYPSRIKVGVSVPDGLVIYDVSEFSAHLTE